MPIRRGPYDDVPPPLPPPQWVPVAGPTDPNNDKYKQKSQPYDDHRGATPDSFGLSFARRDIQSRHDFQDEGYHSMGSSIRPSFGSHFRNANDEIDKSMLSKLNRPARRSALSASLNEPPTSRPNHTQLSALSLPHRSKPSSSFLDSGFTKSPVPMSAVSPRNSPFTHGGSNYNEYRSPLGPDPTDFEHSPVPRTQRTNSGSIPDDITVTTQGSYEVRDDEVGFPMEETSRMRSLNIDDPWRERERGDCYQQTGQKRRASSPPSDDIPLPSDLLRRREGCMTRGSPTPRLTVIPQGSVSSISSASRNGSYASNLTASSMTSYNSFGRRSPNLVSPGGAMSPTDQMHCGSPYSTPISLTTSPRSMIGRSSAAQLPHQRRPSEQSMAGQDIRELPSPRRLTEIPKNPSSLLASKLKGPYMCECCPKKPKKFETEDELKLHEAEKQYECTFCGNRFKNKNEAERHQNSLHVRRHSWSCSALTGYERAFHESTIRPGEGDACGYCGDEFLRSGRNPTGGVFITEQDWEDRIRHLQDIHKFRECNSGKKFYRADHFRQHLKHSHAGTSGKWTNMLENACMLEEDPPVPKNTYG
ncbi:hypothetical protein B0T22DRAFT_498991 [Podospora appendiculata]|uniref:C2H2-type domain-containing protein n=1 Tax=Podospora appendiculata TaxID=314037 RepID=A0AAE0XAI5_9PEZI|nr:hypothetical protein B0T22DRAFT_498991 [Podospora appendiculata]